MEFKKKNNSICKLSFSDKTSKPDKNVELVINVKSDHNIDMIALESLLQNIKNYQIQGYKLEKK